MKDKINVAELLKDCPSGMELDCTMYDDVFFYEITDDLIFPIRIKRIDGAPITLTKYGGYADCPTSKCVIFPKGKTTWEGFQRPFKNGDILTTDMGSIFIFSHLELDSISDRNICKAYVGIQNTRPISFFHTEQSDFFGPYESMCKLATEEEKQKLFQAIKDNGYKWNPDNKALEKVIELKFKVGDKINPIGSDRYYIIKNIEFDRYVLNSDQFLKFTDEHDFELAPNKLVRPKFKVGDRIKHKTHYMSQGDVVTEIKNTHYFLNDEFELPFTFQDEWELLVPNKFDVTTLKPFDKVLVRCSTLEKWRIQLFEKYDKTYQYPFICMGCNKYKQCIPYEGNEHLLDTADDCDEFYRTWEKNGD